MASKSLWAWETQEELVLFVGFMAAKILNDWTTEHGELTGENLRYAILQYAEETTAPKVTEEHLARLKPQAFDNLIAQYTSSSSSSSSSSEPSSSEPSTSSAKRQRTTTPSVPSDKIEISPMKYAKVSKIGNNRNVVVDVRVYYKDQQGTLKPTQKGISLLPDQWDVLYQNFDKIDEMIKTLSSR